MTVFLNKKLLTLTIAAMGLAAFLVAVVLSPAAARAECLADQFTVNGVFDLQGYLACQVASSPAGGTASTTARAGGLPATGSDTMQIVGIALALVAVGIAAVVVSVNDRRTRA